MILVSPSLRPPKSSTCCCESQPHDVPTHRSINGAILGNKDPGLYPVLKLKTTAAVVRGKKQLLPTIKAEGTSFVTLVGGKIQNIN
jgi:hypothetical protein